VTNVILYSLREDTNQFYRLFTSWYGDDFVVRLEDAGPPFDPDTLPEVDVTLPLDERQIGGLGWLIIRQSTDEVKVFRSADTNILTMVRSRHRPTVGQKKQSKEPIP
ncbi:MAG: ATP-binding protein, partial [Deltaproteobacteria bacterium]